MFYNENKPIHYSLNWVEVAEINCENTSSIFILFIFQHFRNMANFELKLREYVMYI